MGSLTAEWATWIAPILAFTLSIVFIQLLTKIAPIVGLIDRPDGTRKHHVGSVPVVGGVAMYFAVLGACAFIGLSDEVLLPLLIGCVLVVLGLLDDLLSLGTRLRILLQMLCASAMLLLGGNAIISVGNLFGQGPVAFTVVWLGGLFTVLCTVGVINSINMIDGMDGLSGTLNVISLSVLAFYSHVAADGESLRLILACVAALLGFLYFNSRIFRHRATVFMGDAGSTFFGFILVWFYIKLTQGETAVLSPVSAGWIFGLPMADTISVMVGRIRRGKSPFAAGRDHLHHQLQDNGFTVNKTLAIMVILQVMFVTVGVVNNTAPFAEVFIFWLFVFIVVVHHFFTPRVLTRFSTPKNKLVDQV